MKIDKKLLITKYWDEEKSSIIIAKELGRSKAYILKKMKIFNIPRRNQKVAQQINLRNKNHHPLYKNIPKNELIKLHIKEKKTTIEIANLLNVSNQCIRQKLTEFGVTINNYYRKRKNAWNKGKNTKTDLRIKQYINNNPRLRKDINRKLVYDLYSIQERSIYQIAKLLKSSPTLISKRLKKYKIPTREINFGFGYKNDLRCDDGHMVKSTAEREIDNWLFHSGIIHVYDKKLGFGQFKTDFYIPMANIWIEYWGLQSVKTYREKTKRKLEIYKSLGLSLLSIFPSDNIQKKLNFLLQYSQIQKPLEVYI